MSSGWMNTGFSPRNTLAMKPGAKLSSTAISAAGAHHVAVPTRYSRSSAHDGLEPDAETWIALTRRIVIDIIVQRVVGQASRKVGSPNPVVPRAEFRRRIGRVLSASSAIPAFRLGKGAPDRREERSSGRPPEARRIRQVRPWYSRELNTEPAAQCQRPFILRVDGCHALDHRPCSIERTFGIFAPTVQMAEINAP